jgi:crossover junction endodeoxyribonuclease RusA
MRRAGKVDAPSEPIELVFEVIGEPAPQGSKRHVGKGILVESSKKVKPWREAVIWAVREGPRVTLDGPIHVGMDFYFRRPKSAPKSRQWPDRKPDLDKLVRSTLDALVMGGAITDDARVVCIDAWKFYCGCGEYAFDVPGAKILVRNV